MFTGTQRDQLANGRWLTVGQACRALGVDASTLRRWANSGHIRTFRTPGGHRRFAESDVRELIAGRAQETLQYRDLSELALTRIRRQLHRGSAQRAAWYTTVDEADRERLRPLGRRLAALAATYLSRRNGRHALLDDARRLGQAYGRQLAASGLPLPQAMEAFIFFRRGLDDATRQASQRHGLSTGEALGACQQVSALADQVLLGLTEAYQDQQTQMSVEEGGD